MLADLARSGLVPEDLGATARPFPWPGNPEPCYVIPYYGIDGQIIPQMFRIRMNNAQRYSQPSGEQIGALANSPYLGSHTSKLTGDIRIIAEGEKKAAAVQKRLGIPTLGIGGADNWRFQRELHPTIADFVRGATTVLLLPDADFRRPNIGLSYRRLAEEVQEIGVGSIQLWMASDKIDDFLVAHPEVVRVEDLEWTDYETALRESPEGLQRRYFLTGAVSAAGRVILDANAANVRCLLEAHPAFKSLVKFNRDMATIEYDPLPGDPAAQILMHLQANFALAKLQIKAVQIAVAEEANRNSYSPRAEWLRGLEWDGKPRIDTWVLDWLGVPDTPAAREISRKWLIASCARIFEEGESIVDFMVILKGAQRIGKSSIPGVLYGSGNVAELVKGASEGKDLQMIYVKNWAVVDNELDHMNRSEAHAYKNLITIRTDTFRPPYGAKVLTYPRRCVLIGTSNEVEFLAEDTSGQARYGILETSVPEGRATFDFDGISAVRDQLWAEAVARYEKREQYSNLYWASENAQKYVRSDVTKEVIEGAVTSLEMDKHKVADLIEAPEFPGQRCVWLTTAMVLTRADLRINNYAEGRKAAEVLRGMGYTKIEQRRIAGVRYGTVWIKPAG